MKKILLIEDDQLIASIYQKKLAAAGFEVAVAEDGLAAVKRLPAFGADLVVLDLLLPKLSGADVLTFIRQQKELKSTRVIVLSNAFLSKLGEQVVALGVDELLAKAAATPELLITTINNVLQRPAKEVPEARPAKPAAPTPSARGPVQSVRRGHRPRIRIGASEKTGVPRAHPARLFRTDPHTFEKCSGPDRGFSRHDGFRNPIAAAGSARSKNRVPGSHDRNGRLPSDRPTRQRVRSAAVRVAGKPASINESVRHTITATSALLVDFLNRPINRMNNPSRPRPSSSSTTIWYRTGRWYLPWAG